MSSLQTTYLLPSYPAPDFKLLETFLNQLSGIAPAFQVDMVDGVFAPFCSWPFTDLSDPQNALHALTPYAATFSLEADCMCMEPELYLDTFVAVGFQSVVVHIGSTKKYDDIFAHARMHGYAVGLGCVNDVPLEEVYPHIPRVDFVQLMGIKEIGQQGQPFDERTLDRVRTLRTHYPELTIAIDGSVNRETIPKLRAAGANKFAPGSAITRALDPRVAYTELLSIAQQHEKSTP